MDLNLTYAKTPAGEEATRQRTRVVQRNLRMVLLQVDGQVRVNELIAKIGNEALVINALKELEKGGYICLAADAPSVWEQSKARLKAVAKGPVSDSPISAASELSDASAASDFSGFDQSAIDATTSVLPSQFSTFGKRVEPVAAVPEIALEPAAHAPAPAAGGGAMQALRDALGKIGEPKEGKDLKPLRKIRVLPLVASGLAVILAAIALLIVFYPYDSYRPQLEAALGKALGAPVKIGSVEAQFSPAPSLILGQVNIGKNGEANIGKIRIPGLLSLRGGGIKEIRDAEIANARLSTDFLAQLDSLDGGLTNGAAGFKVAHLSVQGLNLLVGDLALPPMSGEVLFNGGKLEKVALKDDDHSLRLEIFSERGATLVSAEGFAWRPAGSDGKLSFSAIQFKGTLTPGALRVQNLDANMLNGNVVANFVVDWTKGMRVSGEAQVTRISAKQLSKLLDAGVDIDGDLGGTLRFSSEADHGAGLWKALQATMTASVTRGIINGVDVGEAARRGEGKAIRGGTTKFERLFATLSISPAGVSSSDLDLDAGLLRANGRFTAQPDKTVDANLQVGISSSVMPIRVRERINGTLPTLEALAVK